MNEKILEVKDLQVRFDTEEGCVQAVDRVHFTLHRGETLGLVGESGCGKSVTNLALLGLVPSPPGKIDGGEALYRGKDLLRMSASELSHIRGNRIAMIFQDPMTSLNPYMTISDQLTEVTMLHLGHTRREAVRHAIEMLGSVGIASPDRRIDEYPHQFSGGMRQRVMIAMAISCRPEVLIADEPTTALDVTIQAQILELMKQLQAAEGTAIIMITHDMGVVANICHRVDVMYAGRIVEQATCEELFKHPRHPYTLGLLESVPRIQKSSAGQLEAIDGQPPDLAALPAGCAFEPRCRFSEDRCIDERPMLRRVTPSSQTACFFDLENHSQGSSTGDSDG